MFSLVTNAAKPDDIQAVLIALVMMSFQLSFLGWLVTSRATARFDQTTSPNRVHNSTSGHSFRTLSLVCKRALLGTELCPLVTDAWSELLAAESTGSRIGRRISAIFAGARSISTFHGTESAPPEFTSFRGERFAAGRTDSRELSLVDTHGHSIQHWLPLIKGHGQA